MKKDTIYIDTEDDITSIIDKVKASGEKIIALVPPKRVGVLQSAVNLKLLQKSAKSADKRIVIITTNKSLASLAAGVSIPVAKNLQSKPELASVQAMPSSAEADEDVIQGEELPVGELAKTGTPAQANVEDEAIELPEDLSTAATAASKGPKKSKAKKAGPNIPNFDLFRKKLFLAIAGGVLFLLFLIWAIFFAPHATVNIKAKTSSEAVNIPVGLNINGETDVDSKVIKPIAQQVKKTFSADFDATGKKDIGTKATGTVTIKNCGDSDAISVPGGTTVSSDGRNFLTASSVTVPGGKFNITGCTKAGTASVSVQAQDVGESYNLSSGSDFSVSGQNSGVSATNSSSFSGGTKRTATVVSDSDVNTAKSKLLEQNGEAARQELTKKYDTKKFVIINKSYKADPTTITSSPSAGSETSKAKLTVEITYTLIAMEKDDVNQMLNAFLKDKIGEEENQKIYDNGLKKLQFDEYSDTSVKFKTTGYIGPNIDTKNIKPQLVGKNFEEIRQKIRTVEGVEDVETSFFPFWVSTAPGEDKIDIKFVIKKDD